MSGQMLSEERLKELSKDPQNRVMMPKFDMHQPWPVDRIKKVVSSIASRAQKGETKESMLGDEVISLFAKNHPILFSKVSDVEFLSNEKYVKCMEYIINQRHVADAGSSAEAASNVQTMALKTCMQTDESCKPKQ